MLNRPIVIGHQGNAGTALANTLAGFEEAISLGADMIEVDLRVTADGEVVLFHDDAVDKYTDVQYGYLTDLVRLAHLRGLSVWAWTVDEEADIRHVLGFGVDAIYSNWPGKVIEILDECVDSG